MPTKIYEDYELYMTVAEEEELLIATSGDELDDKDGGGLSNEKEIMPSWTTRH